MTTENMRTAESTASHDSGCEGVQKTNPLVTVVITTYNRPLYLSEAVESVQQQTYSPLELVVVDDHSDKPAKQVLASVSQDGLSNVECIRHSENRGANAARNTGIRHASGKYVAFLDDDDRWLPEKVARQVNVFQENEGVGVTYTGAENIYSDESDTFIPSHIEGDLTKHLLCQNVVGTLSAVMVRTDLARETPLDEGFPSWADLEWYVRLSKKTTFRRIPLPLVLYEFDSHNRLSDDLDKKRVAYERFIDKFDDLASQYGELFRRKMRAWAAFRLGSTALNMNQYHEARRLFFRALRTYPFEVNFFTYILATLGGRYTHDAARGVKRAVSPILNVL